MGGWKSVAGSTHGHVLVHTAYYLHLRAGTLYIYCLLNMTFYTITHEAQDHIFSLFSHL